LPAVQRSACCFLSAVQHSAPHFSFRRSEFYNVCSSVTLLVEQRYMWSRLAFSTLSRSFPKLPRCTFFSVRCFLDDVFAACLQSWKLAHVLPKLSLENNTKCECPKPLRIKRLYRIYAMAHFVLFNKSHTFGLVSHIIY